ncbi:MAG: PilZ domain-containing protein [Terriglobales bacterium]|jgi:hypothetical protein
MSADPYSARIASDRSPLQRYRRAQVSVPVTICNLGTGGLRSSPGVTLDIGEGGLGAIVCGELRVGEMVKVDIRIAERTLSTVAIVRHSSNVRSGFEFVGLTADERLQIANCMGQS